MKDAELWSRQDAVLGEGPRWDVDGQRLLWVDIASGRVLATTERSTEELVKLSGRASAVFQRSGGGLVVAGDTELHTIDAAGATTRVAVEARGAGRCLNDGACDSAGRVWVGSAVLDEGAPPTGALFRVDGGGPAALVRGVAMGNGIGWSPDERLLYFVDSAQRRIDVYDFDVERGKVSHRREFARFADGIPDGLAVDADGCVWVALWGAGQVRRLAPDGATISTVAVAVSQPSSCTFGGPRLTDLLITTARLGVADADRREPLAGSIFCVADAGVGCAPNRAAL